MNERQMNQRAQARNEPAHCGDRMSRSKGRLGARPEIAMSHTAKRPQPARVTLLFNDGEPVALFTFVVQKSEGQVEPVNVED